MASMKEFEKTAFQQDEKDCMEFFPGFLDCLDPEVRKDYLKALHGIQKSTIDDPVGECRRWVKHLEVIREEYPSRHFILIRKIVAALNMVNHGSAIDIVEGINNGSFWMYLVLDRLFSRKGYFEEAFFVAMKQIESVGGNEPLKKAVATIHLALNARWHGDHEIRIKSSYYQTEAVSILKSLGSNLSVVHDPTTEEATLLLEAYRGAALSLKLDQKSGEAMEYNYKIFQIYSLSPASRIQALKSHSIIAHGHAVNMPSDSYSHIMEAFKLLDLVMKDEYFMINHTGMVVHCLSKLAHCFKVMHDNSPAGSKNNYLKKSLKSRLRLLKMAKRYLGASHPEVARTHSLVAKLYSMTGRNDKRYHHAGMAEQTLRGFDYENDEEARMKHTKELFDALRTLGDLYCLDGNFANGEKKYKSCLALAYRNYGIRNYGEFHVLIAKAHRGLGHLYRKCGHFSEAERHFEISREIHEQFPTNVYSENMCRNISCDLRSLRREQQLQKNSF